MPKCTVTRTHHRGRKLNSRDWDQPIPGPVQHESTMHPTLNRWVSYLRVVRMMHGGMEDREPLPRLYEPQILTFGSDGGCMIAGFEEIDGHRYYQGWYIQWE